MSTHRLPLALLSVLAMAACTPKPDAAGGEGAAAGTGAGVPTAGVTATPVAQVAKFDYGTQPQSQGGQLLWQNASVGVPSATPEYACSTEHTVSIDSSVSFKSEPAGKCPDGRDFYKLSW